MKSKARILVVLEVVLSLGLMIAACAGPQPAPTPVPHTPTTIPPPPIPIPPTPTTIPPTPTTIPPTPTTISPTSTLQPPDAVVTLKALNLREGPGIAYPVIGVLKQGDTLTVTGRSPDKGWIEVITAKGKKGWCSALDKYVQLNVNLDKVAIAQNIPPEPIQVAVAPTQPPTAARVEEPTKAPTQAPPTKTPTPQVATIELYFFFRPVGCPYSASQAPIVEQFYKKYGGVAFFQGGKAPGLAAPPVQGSERVNVIGIYDGRRYSLAQAQSFTANTGITFPIRASNGEIEAAGVIGYPTIAIKQAGVFRTVSTGVVSLQTLESAVANARAGRSISPGSGGHT